VGAVGVLKGRAMTFEQVTAYALEDDEALPT
jgi:hypothetical protein